MRGILRRGRIALLLAAAGVASTCVEQPTEVFVEITTDLSCAELRGVAITGGVLGEIETKPADTITMKCSPERRGARIGSIVLTPSGGSSDRFAIKVVAGTCTPEGVCVGAEECQAPEYASCIVSRRATRFVPHEKLTLPIVLRGSCKDLPCDVEETCVAGRCLGAEIPDTATCSGNGCGEDVLRPVDEHDGGNSGMMEASATGGVGGSSTGGAAMGGAGGAIDASATGGVGGVGTGGMTMDASTTDAADGAPPSCTDGVQNQGESAADCGGQTMCPRCAAGSTCTDPGDCTSSVCAGTCQAPTCSDGVQNGSETGLDCGGGCGPCGGCPVGAPGPTMVEVPAPVGGLVTSYCMDSTEVTNAQYAAFLAAGHPTSGQDQWCSWNTDYTPSSGWPATGKDDHPVVYVDWCDAYAYCEWAGKRLCGRIGGGANAYSDYADATRSEWFNACSEGGLRRYSIGDTYNGTACNGSGSGVGDTVPTGSMATREGGYAGLFDLSGNVWEWENSCDGAIDKNDNCRTRGGSFSGTTLPTCSSTGDGLLPRDRNDPDLDVGFRCCAPA